MGNIPVYLSLVFIITTFITGFLFYLATGRSKIFLIVSVVWLVLQGILANTGFFLNTEVSPPRFFLLIIPPLIFIVMMFATPKGRIFIDKTNTGLLTVLHTFRVPVEFILLALYLHQFIPRLMTFEGRNFDILSGLSAPFIYYFGYRRKKLSAGLLLAWNIICLALLINIVTHAVFSLPSPFQKLAFDQPNIAVMHFPFTWLPAFIVPLVLFSHLISIRRLLIDKKNQNSAILA